MKMRKGYVSNSSSSSFIIAYDENFFGNLKDFLENFYLGESSIYDFEKYKDLYLEDLDEEKEEYEKLIEEEEKSGKTICCLNLDYDFCFIVDLLQNINKMNGNDKLNIILNTNE